jgi:ribosomal protein S18 acetylase RimI-like enzyme
MKSAESMESSESNEHIVTRKVATVEDKDFAFKTHQDAYRDVFTRQFPGDKNEYDEVQLNLFNRIWEPEKYEIIMDGDIPCGILWMERQPDFIYIHELVVAPEFQNRGIGTKVLEDIIHISEQQGVSIQLDVLKENTAIGLYEKMGFVQIGATHINHKMERIINSKE